MPGNRYSESWWLLDAKPTKNKCRLAGGGLSARVVEFAGMAEPKRMADGRNGMFGYLRYDGRGFE